MRPRCEVTITDIALNPDASRVLAKPFVPGLEDVGPTGSRAGAVIERILRLDESEVSDALTDVTKRFAGRHRDIEAIWHAQSERVLPLMNGSHPLSAARKLLIGAYFTHEYAIEGAALANPSMVPWLDTASDGSQAFVLSVRCIGEGHRSAIGFRTGAVTADGSIRIDPPSRFVTYAGGEPGVHSRRVFHARLDNLGHDLDELAQLLSMLPPMFDDADLGSALAALTSSSPRPSTDLMTHANALSQWAYRVEFPEETEISERVLWPHAPPEYHGMEDARFVLFHGSDGAATYFATYTAFDRNVISLQLLETNDFRSFTSGPMAGTAALGKGMALFPRQIGNEYVALTRSDRETNGIAMSDDLRHWEATEQVQVPHEAWEATQLGNCGSPIETPDGWLVLTHGVGPMRTYSMGAILLDLDHPTKVIGRTVEPILAPSNAERDGYVPNVVYSCGAMAHGDQLVIPYGIADQRIGVATLSLQELIGSMA